MTSRLSAVFGYEGLVKDGSILSRSQKKYIFSAICLGGFLVTREYSGMGINRLDNSLLEYRSMVGNWTDDGNFGCFVQRRY